MAIYIQVWIIIGQFGRVQLLGMLCRMKVEVFLHDALFNLIHALCIICNALCIMLYSKWILKMKILKYTANFIIMYLTKHSLPGRKKG